MTSHSNTLQHTLSTKYGARDEINVRADGRNNGECNHSPLSVSSVSACDAAAEKQILRRTKRRLIKQQGFLLYSCNFSLFFFIFLSVFLPSLTTGRIKSCYGNKRGKNRRRKPCHPHRDGGTLTFSCRTERKRKMEGGRETEGRGR